MDEQKRSDALDGLCQRSGLSKAALLRKLILSEPIKERPNADFLDLIQAIDRIGVNFNQLVRRANAADTVSGEDIREARRVYDQVLRLLQEWRKTWW